MFVFVFVLVFFFVVFLCFVLFFFFFVFLVFVLLLLCVVLVVVVVLWFGCCVFVATATGEYCTVRGAEYPSAPSAFGNIFWKHGWVLGTRAGLLISLVND